MLKKSALILFLVVVIHIFESLCKTGKYDEPSYNGVKVKNKTSGISAWGLILLIVSLILFGVVVYYFVTFYPLLCKKERKYGRIELTTV